MEKRRYNAQWSRITKKVGKFNIYWWFYLVLFSTIVHIDHYSVEHWDTRHLSLLILYHNTTISCCHAVYYILEGKSIIIGLLRFHLPPINSYWWGGEYYNFYSKKRITIVRGYPLTSKMMLEKALYRVTVYI